MSRRRLEVVRIRVSVAWWLRLYLQSVVLFASITGMEPDRDKVGRAIARGVSFRLGWRAELNLLAARLRRWAARVPTLWHPWIHHPGDGRGQRFVYLDGEMVRQCIYADTRRGIVRLAHEPPRLCPRRLVFRSVRRSGKVTVCRGAPL